MQLGPFLYAWRTCLAAFTPFLGFSLQGEHPLGVGHLHPPPLHIVLVGEFVDVPQASTPHFSGCCPIVVKASAVCPCLKGYVVPEVVSRSVFKSLHQAVVQCSPQVIALLPSHFADVCEGFKAQLGMVLVAPRLLALACFADVVGQGPVVVGRQVIVNSGAIDGCVLKVNATRHAQAVDDGSPVSIGVWTVSLELLHHGKQGTAHHLVPLGGAMGFHQGHGPYKVIALDGAKRRIVAVEPLQRRGVGIDDFKGLFLMPFLRTRKGSFHVALASALRVAVLSVAGHHFVGASHAVIGLCLQVIDEEGQAEE